MKRVTKRFGELTIEPTADGRVRVGYGAGRGWQTFDDLDEALTELDAWSDRELSETAKRLASLVKLRRYIRKELI